MVLAGFDPWSFVAQAEGLKVAPDAPEANYRSAVSRAYYACYLTARDRIYGLDAQPQTASAHAGLIKEIRDRTLAEQMDKLMRMRVCADYRTSLTRVREFFHENQIANGWMDLADRAVSLANAMRQDLSQLPTR